LVAAAVTKGTQFTLKEHKTDFIVAAVGLAAAAAEKICFGCGRSGNGCGRSGVYFLCFVCTVSEWTADAVRLAAAAVVVCKSTVCVDQMVQIELYLDMIKYSRWMEPIGSVVDWITVYIVLQGSPLSPMNSFL
jgi:hypothetical protein